MRRRTMLTAAGLLAVGAAAPHVAGAAGTEQDRVDAAIVAFTELVEGAGFVSDVPADDSDTDLLDVVPDEGEDPASYVCTDPMFAAVAEDGSFVGEMARAVSDGFTFNADETASTDDLNAMDETDTINAAAAIVDDDGMDELETILEVIGSDELASCFNDLYAEVAASEPADANASITVESDADLGVGDQSGQVVLGGSYEIDGEQFSYTATISAARVGNAFAIVFLETTNGQKSDLAPEDALAALVDAL